MCQELKVLAFSTLAYGVTIFLYLCVAPEGGKPDRYCRDAYEGGCYTVFIWAEKMVGNDCFAYAGITVFSGRCSANLHFSNGLS